MAQGGRGLGEPKALLRAVLHRLRLLPACPKGINIPRIFQAYTYHNVYGLHELAKKTYLSYVNDEKKPGATSKDCVGCGYCERKCPQHLKVRELLKKVEGVLEAL